MVKSGTSETLEMVLMAKDRGARLDIVQPNARIPDGKLFREGSFIGGPITGRWELEVKCWPLTKKSSGISSIEGQVKSDVVRAGFVDDFLDVTKPVGEINGRYWRFARAGENNENFTDFSKAVKNAYEKELRDQVLRHPSVEGIAEKEAAMKEKIAAWIQDRFKVDETKPEDFSGLFPDLITP
jgi:hypothetical protein